MKFKPYGGEKSQERWCWKDKKQTDLECLVSCFNEFDVYSKVVEEPGQGKGTFGFLKDLFDFSMDNVNREDSNFFRKKMPLESHCHFNLLPIDSNLVLWSNLIAKEAEKCL